MNYILEQIKKIKKRMPKSKAELKSDFLDIKSRFANESKETKEMWEIYMRSLHGMATSKEITWANGQAVDVFRSVGLAGIIIIPGTPFILPIIIALASTLGIDILPSSFRDKYNNEDK